MNAKKSGKTFEQLLESCSNEISNKFELVAVASYLAHASSLKVVSFSDQNTNECNVIKALNDIKDQAVNPEEIKQIMIDKQKRSFNEAENELMNEAKILMDSEIEDSKKENKAVMKSSFFGDSNLDIED